MMRVARLAWLVWLFFAAPVWAASPLDYTRATLERARAVVSGDQTHNDKLATLSVLFRSFLDSDEMGRQALGAHWSSFTPAQQREFLILFRELFERIYVAKLLLFEQPQFAYVGEARDGNEVRVDTKIITPRDDFDVVYQLRAEGDHWRATRITVEDINLTANLGNQLNDLLAKTSVENLLDLMRRKYGSGAGGNAQ